MLTKELAEMADREALRRIDETTEKINELIAQRADLRRERVLHCEHCDSAFKSCEADIVDVQWYVEPTGCTGGDYYTHSYYKMICPLCEQATKLEEKPTDTTFKSLKTEHQDGY